MDDCVASPVMVGLVLALDRPASEHGALRERLAGLPGFTLGEASGCWLPCAAEADDPRELHRFLESLPGVLAVDVAFVEVPPAVPAASTAPET